MNKGFVTTFILVVVMSLTLAGVLGVATRTISVLRYDRIMTNRAQVVFSANACAEAALLSIRDGGASSGSVSDGAISCTYSISDLGGGAYTVTAIGTESGVSKTISVSVSSNDPVTVSSFVGLQW